MRKMIEKSCKEISNTKHANISFEMTDGDRAVLVMMAIALRNR